MAADASYHPDEDQRALAGALDDSLAALLPLARLHGSTEETADVWAELDALGAFAMGVAEDQGGSGLGVVEEALIVMSLGRRMASPTVLATIGAAPALLVQGAPVAGPAARVAAGYRTGGGVVVVEDADAELLLVRDGETAAVYRAERPFTPLDERYWTGRLQRAGDLGAALARLEGPDLLRVRLLDAAALAGLAQTATEMAVAYARMREQFGRPIGSFQAVKHACADMAIAARCARDQTGFAAVALAQDRPGARLQVESALYVAARAALDNASANIQVHGGIGFSDEADPHLLLKRAQLLVAVAGGVEAVVERLADLPESLAA